MNNYKFSKDQVFLKNKDVLAKIQKIIGPIPGAILEIGPGKGAITKTILEKDLTCVEMDEIFKPELEKLNIKNLVFGRFQDIILDNKYDTLISNLPFNQIVDILLHAYKHYDKIKSYYVIVPTELAKKFLAKSAIGFKMRYLFDIKKLFTISPCAYSKNINQETSFIVLYRKENADLLYWQWLSEIKHPNKKLKNNFNQKFESKYGDLRIAELDDNKLLEI